MYRIKTATFTKAYRQKCQDRVAVFREGERTVLVVADGAGGMGSGDFAAETVIREVESSMARTGSANEWSALLKQIDYRIPEGESTAVVVDLRPYGIAGASVGDSQAWIIHDGEITNLTTSQNRKPLLGSGNAAPVPLMHTPLQGLLLMGTDGFFNYVKRDKLTPMVSQAEFFSIPRRCMEMVQLRSGELWDDIGIIAAKQERIHQQQRYDL